jgi:hypothetical protein
VVSTGAAAAFSTGASAASAIVSTCTDATIVTGAPAAAAIATGDGATITTFTGATIATSAIANTAAVSTGAFTALAGNVADMSRHVGDDKTCHSNFGQMGPCRRHKIEDVVAVCVGLSRHLPDFRNSYVEIYSMVWEYIRTESPMLISVMFWFCHVLVV